MRSISCQLTSNKAFKRGSSFCSSSRLYFGHMSHDTICRNLSRRRVASCVSKRGSSFCSLSQLNLQNEDPIDFLSVGNEQSITTVFVDTRLWKTKHSRKRFQNFRQSYVLSTCRIEIHQSQPASMA